MERYKIKINKINIENDKISINSTYVSTIYKGSVDFRIFNESNKEMSLGDINEGDLITIYGTKNNENNNIYIKKIKIKDKYILLSDSESSDIMEFE
jgi:tRNA(Ile2) C34 agmatinyltransferase TiaS